MRTTSSCARITNTPIAPRQKNIQNNHLCFASSEQRIRTSSLFCFDFSELPCDPTTKPKLRDRSFTSFSTECELERVCIEESLHAERETTDKETISTMARTEVFAHRARLLINSNSAPAIQPLHSGIPPQSIRGCRTRPFE